MVPHSSRPKAGASVRNPGDVDVPLGFLGPRGPLVGTVDVLHLNNRLLEPNPPLRSPPSHLFLLNGPLEEPCKVLVLQIVKKDYVLPK